MKRLIVGLICVSIPFLAFYNAVAVFSSNESAQEDRVKGGQADDSYNLPVKNEDDNENDSPALGAEDDLLIVVDREHGLAPDYVPEDLVHLRDVGIKVRDNSMQLRRIVIADLKAMFDAAEKAGHKLMVFSAYRSYQSQQQVYNYWVSTLGQSEADRTSAKPGHSEHQLGTTIDITAVDIKGDVFSEFGDSEPGKWLARNAFKFGFVMSYPPDSESLTGYKYEPWHFRYVGKKAARIIHDQDLVPVMYLMYLASKEN